MAKSARQAQLEAQRNPYKNLRILAPQNSAVNTIAKRTATAELSIMTEKYNDGLIGNEEFRAFLNKQLANPGITENDKAEIEDKVRDFDTLVRKDQLEAVFRSAPENSLEKVTAAQALSNFYKDRAATMVPGTPAHSTALENAGSWSNQAVSVQNTVEKQARTNYRYVQEQKIYQLPTGSSDQAYAKSEMYQKLAEQAAADGDATEMNRFVAQAQQYATMGDQYVEREGERSIKEGRGIVVDALNQALNGYHDGTVSAEELYQVLSEVDAYALENEDTSLQLKVNTEADRVAKIEAKGGLRRGTAGGLPVVLGKGKGGSGGGTDWDEADYKYSNGLRAFDAEYKAGLSNAEEYAESVGELLTQRQKDVITRLETAEAVASENPNAKIMYNGKKTRAADVVEALYKEADELDGQVQAYNNGSFTLLEIPPDQFNTSGSFKKSGKNVATYQIVDPSSIPPEAMDNYMMDSEGILHAVQGDYVSLTADQLKNVVGGYYTDENGQSYKVITDPKSGLSTIRMNSRVDLYDPSDRTRKVTLTLTGDEESIPGYEEAFQQQTKNLESEARQADIQQSKEKAVEVPNLDLRTPVQKIQEAAQPVVDQVGKVVQSAAEKIPDVIKQSPFQAIAPKVGEVVQPALDKVQDVAKQVSSVVQPVLPKIQEAVSQSPISYAASKINAPSGVSYNSGSMPITKVDPSGQKLVKQVTNKGFTYEPVKPPPYLKQNQQAQQPSIGTKILSVVKQSPFDFLKKKLGF